MSGTLREILAPLTDRLRAVTDQPWLDVMILTEWASGSTRADLVAALGQPPSESLTHEARALIESAVVQREAGLPVARITGRRAFWQHEYCVGPGVLVPRPETEHLVEAAIEAVCAAPPGVPGPLAVLDGYTGSGCIGIEVATELRARGREVTLTLADASAEALRFAAKNAERILGTSLAWRTVEIDHLALPNERFALITANPPYLTTAETNEVVSHGWDEPVSAFDGGDDGLDAYRRIAADAVDRLEPGGYLVCEHGATQQAAVVELLGAAGLTIEAMVPDLAGRPRIIVACSAR